jgi:hypothetical protein
VSTGSTHPVAKDSTDLEENGREINRPTSYNKTRVEVEWKDAEVEENLFKY